MSAYSIRGFQHPLTSPHLRKSAAKLQSLQILTKRFITLLHPATRKTNQATNFYNPFMPTQAYNAQFNRMCPHTDKEDHTCQPNKKSTNRKAANIYKVRFKSENLPTRILINT